MVSENLTKNIDKVIYIVVFGLLIATQIHFFATQPPRVELNPQVLEWIRIEGHPFSLGWQLNSGANKPLIKYQGTPVLELSGWAGGILLPGFEERKTFWMHHFTITFDEEAIYNTWRGANYAIEWIARLEGDSVVIRIFLVPFPPTTVLRDVDIVFDFYCWDFEEKFLVQDDIAPALVWRVGELPDRYFKMTFLIPPDGVELHEVNVPVFYRLHEVERRVLVAEFVIEEA